MIVYKYIAREIFWPVLVAFFFLNILFLVVQILKIATLAVGVGLGLMDMLHIVLYSLPSFAVFTIPIAVLTGVLLGLGRMTADGELVALAGAGVSNLGLSAVPAVIGVAASLMAFCFASWVAPAANMALRRTFVDLSKRHIAASLDPGRFFDDIPGVVLFPRRTAGAPGEFDGLMMFDRRPGRARHLLFAARAKVKPGRTGNFLDLNLAGGEVHVLDRRRKLYSLAMFEKASVAIDIDRLVDERTRFISPADSLDLSELAAVAGERSRSPREQAVYSAAWQRRFAFPAAAFFFSLLACALGATGKLRGRRRTLPYSAGVVAAYYLLSRAGDAVAGKAWLHPALVAWLPDIIIFGLACWLLVLRGRRAG